MKNMMDNILQTFLNGFKNCYFLRVGNKNHNLFIGKDEDGYYCFEFRGVFSPIKIIGSKPLLISQSIDKEHNIFILRFSLESDELIGCFSAFCEDLIESVDSINDDNAIYKTLSSRYKAWCDLFKPNHTILNELEIMGLIGELLFLKMHAIQLWGIDAAIDSWTGPEKTHKDFSHKNEWVEVKTVSVGKDTVRISSLEQLDSDISGYLLIYSLERMSPSYNGICLNKIVADILEVLSSIQKDAFLNKLKLFDYDFNPSYDNYLYSIKNEVAFLVQNDFPLIKRSKLPLSISKVQYDIKISDLTPFITKM